MRKVTGILLFLIITIFQGYSKPVTADEIQQIVRAFTASAFPGDTEYRIGAIIPVADGQRNALYIVNLVPEGWILLSGEDKTLPVLGYSPTGSFSSNFTSENPVRSWIDYYVRSVDLAGKDQSLKRNELWDGNGSGFRLKSAQATTVDPFLTVEWDQNNTWNRYCPSDEEGPGGHAYVGCVGVSMAQAMSVYRYPLQGTSSKTYFHEDYGTIIIHYDREAPYQWDSMALATADKYNSRLLYHAAVSVEMNFGHDGSSAQTRSVPTAMNKYFRYYSGIKYTARPDDDEVWTGLLTAELVAGRPVIYSGYPGDGTAGHAFNIDGVDSRGYFHLNWGWSGSYNGWYLINNLRPGSNDFTKDQGAVTNIRPPVYCPTDLSLTKTSVKENMPAGTYVGKLKITDEASDNKYNRTIKGDSVGENEYLEPDFYLSNDSLKTRVTFTWAEKSAYNIYIAVTDTLGHTYQEKFIIGILKNPVTAVMADPDNPEITVWPNPSDGRFYISNPERTEYTVELIGQPGNILYNKIYRTKDETIELNYPVPGLYTIRLTNPAGHSIFRKVIIR